MLTIFPLNVFQLKFIKGLSVLQGSLSGQGRWRTKSSKLMMEGIQTSHSRIPALVRGESLRLLLGWVKTTINSSAIKHSSLNQLIKDLWQLRGWFLFRGLRIIRLWRPSGKQNTKRSIHSWVIPETDTRRAREWGQQEAGEKSREKQEKIEKKKVNQEIVFSKLQN